MNPFDYQVSIIVYEERVKQSAHQRHLNNNGTNPSVSTKRPMLNFVQTVARLGQVFKLNTQPTTAKSATHIS